LNLQHLRYFEVIAYYQNISKAAQHLMVSQPALSNVLLQLENELETKLFDRQGKILVLNESGKIFLKTVQDILHLLDSSTEQLKNNKRITGCLRICCYIRCVELYNTIAAFTELYPDVQVKIYNSDKLMGNPQLSSYDLVVLPDYECGDFPHITIGARHTMYAILHRSHPLASKKSIRLQELKDDYFSFVSPRDNRLEHAYNRCIEAGFTPKIRYISDNGYDEMRLLLTGSCVTLTYNTNSVFFQHWDDLVAIPIQELPQIQREIALCLPMPVPSALAERFYVFAQQFLNLGGLGGNS